MILFYCFLLSSDILNTRESVSPHFKTPRDSSKNARCTSYFHLFSVWKCDETTSPVFDILLTAIPLIAQITTVIIAITFPLCQNTALVVAGKLGGAASRLCAICMFVRGITTVIIKIAHKSFRDASCVIARELVNTTTRCRGSCK